MAPISPRACTAALTTVVLSLAFALPATASAATLSPAPASQYNTTPNCPVSAADLVCAWNLPVDAGNVFGTGDYGQCPYWAAEKYPALVLGELLSDPLGEDWDGGTWLEHAVEEGLGASTTPASGDLAVWQAEGDDYTGHIAYVEAVVGGAIIVSQMDGDSAAPFPPDQGSTEWISAENLSYFEAEYGLKFISTGSPSSTPLADVEAPAPASAPSTASTPPVAGTPTASPPVTHPTVKKARAKTHRAKHSKHRVKRHRGKVLSARRG